MAKPQTVFVTGASGFIAKHIVLKLLNAGYNVVGSVRSMARADEITKAVTPHLKDAENLNQRLRSAELDLTSGTGWDTALEGADILMHTASPFPMQQPSDENDVIRPAVEGTLRALRAAKAAGIKRVVLTASSVAITNCPLPAGQDAYTEAEWSRPDHPTSTPYSKSKTEAEQAAWNFIETSAPDIALTVINPVLVLGAPLDRNYGTSVQIVERLLRAKDPMLPRFGFAVVDVRDVAEMHVRALDNPQTEGKRFIASDRFLWFSEVAKIIKAAHPDRKIITRQAPNLLVRGLALFDKSIGSIVPILGVRTDMSNAQARQVMGMEFNPAEEAVRRTSAYLIDEGVV